MTEGADQHVRVEVLYGGGGGGCATGSLRLGGHKKFTESSRLELESYQLSTGVALIEEEWGLRREIGIMAIIFNSWRYIYIYILHIYIYI